MDKRKVLEEFYSDPRQPGSFSGPEKLKRSVKQLKKLHVSIKSVKDWLKSKDTYTKHRFARKNFKRNPIIAGEIDEQWQGDLAEVGNLSTHNDGVRYLLILIDVVSKYAWIEPLKSKHGSVVLAALKKIFDGGERIPAKLQTDDGKEFLNYEVQNYLKQKGITFFTLKSDKKAAIAERMVRTIKEKIWRYMHEKHTKRYIDVLGDLVASYNDTYHKSIGMPPAHVNESNEGAVLRKLYGKAWKSDKKEKSKKADLKIGSFVRISRLKGPFKKGYIGNWTEEIFVVDKVVHSRPYKMYKLKDWVGEAIEGSFYSHEIQEVKKDLTGFWKVEKILETKTIRGRKKYFVKWEGYPDAMNSWVDETDIKTVGSGS